MPTWSSLSNMMVHIAGGRFYDLTDRDVLLALVTKRRSAPPIAEIPPQGPNWVNEVLNDSA